MTENQANAPLGDETYTVLVYVDYRKEVEFEVLAMFTNKAAALEFAEAQQAASAIKARESEWYESEQEEEEGASDYEPEYVRLHNAIYDKKMPWYRDFYGLRLAVVTAANGN